MDKHIAKEILSTLEVERLAIIGADFAVIKDCGDKKDALFSDLEKTRAAPNMIAKIYDALRRNQTLLEASLAGVQAAHSRLSALHDVHSNLRVYTQDGQMQQVRAPQQEMNKRS